MPDEFSYEADIAPATTSFLRDVRTNRDLEPDARRRMANNFFGDVSTIRNIRDRNSRFAAASAMDAVQLETAQFNLAQARQRAKQEDEDVAVAAQTDDEIFGILDDVESTPQEKEQALYRLQVEKTTRNPRNSYIHRKFAPAINVVKGRAPEPLTNAQVLDALEAGVPRSVIESGDVAAVGSELSRLRSEKERAALDKEAEKTREQDAEDADKQRGLLQRAVRDVEFFQDPDTLTEDPSRFKNPVTVARIKAALATSPDPELRKIGATETNAAKLRDAYLRDATVTSAPTAPRFKLPPRR